MTATSAGEPVSVLPRPGLVVSAFWLACVGISMLVPVACPFRTAVGLDCPACGATRALQSLMELRVLDAFDHNAGAVLLGLAIAVYLLLARLRWRVPPRLRSSLLGRRPAELLLGLIVGWAIFRNVPALAWWSSSLSQ
jgi:hypothetical protein